MGRVMGGGSFFFWAKVMFSRFMGFFFSRKPGIPEAMNVLLHELRGLALSVKLE